METIIVKGKFKMKNDDRKGLSNKSKIFIGFIFVLLITGIIISLYFGIKTAI